MVYIHIAALILYGIYGIVGVLLIVVLVQTIRILAKTEHLIDDMSNVWEVLTSFRSVPSLLMGIVQKMFSK